MVLCGGLVNQKSKDEHEDEFFRDRMMIACSLQLDLILHECSQILTRVLKPWTGAFSNTNALWHRDTPVYRSAQFPMVSGHSAGRVTLWGCQVTSASWGTLNAPLFHHTQTHKWNTRNKQLFRHAVYMFYIIWMLRRFFPPKAIYLSDAINCSTVSQYNNTYWFVFYVFNRICVVVWRLLSPTLSFCFTVGIYSIWFYDKRDCQRIAQLMVK